MPIEYAGNRRTIRGIGGHSRPTGWQQLDDSKGVAEQPAGAGTAEVSQPKIACRNVWKVFGSDPKGFLARHGGNPDQEACTEEGYIAAVRDVSLDVVPGEMLIVMGLSGSGKSTLVRCLSRLIEPTGGSIDIDGADLLNANPRELIELRRHKMGMVFQNFALLPHRTVLENVAFPLEVQGVGKTARRERALQIVELVGLKGRENYYPRELSGGQQQRVGIARSLAVEPDIWFLDEPFSALDPLIRREMQDEFLRLQSMLHKTIVFITHDFDEALRLGDRIAIMYHGVVDQLGTAEELVLNPATDYVAEFTREVPRANLLSVRSVMEATKEPALEGEPVLVSQRVSEVAPRVLGSDKPVPVVDETGRPLGAVSRERVMEMVFQPGRGPGGDAH